MSDPTIEQRAQDMGWRPQEEFKGDPEKWIDAAEYVRRGEEVLPLVKAENRRLQDKTDNLTKEIQRLTAAVAEQRESMDAMAKFNLTQLQDKLNEQKRQLTAQLRDARREEDDARVEQLEEALEENATERDKVKKVAEAPAAPPQPPQVSEAPEYKEWAAKNTWFNGTSEVDQARTAAAIRFGQEAAAAGKRGQAFFDAVDEKMEKAFPQQRRPDKTEDGRPSGGGDSSSSRDKGFNALPADAKEYAKKQVPKFVGANKMFKTEADWFAYYTKQYNTEAA